MGEWYEEDPWTMGDRFRKAREHTGLDREKFAHLIGVSRNTVINYETGVTTRPVGLIVKAWAMATGTTAEWLIGGRRPTRQGTAATRSVTRRSQRRDTSQYATFHPLRRVTRPTRSALSTQNRANAA